MTECTFNDFGLSDHITKAVLEMGYTKPTPIQEQAIPYVLQGKDVLGIAQTGTGKTAGFTLPMIEILHKGRSKARMPRSLVVSPTRELAAQILDNFKQYSKYTKLSTVLLVGGESMIEQKRVLSGDVDVLICTPGRMLDLHERGNILLNDIKIFVIDEADRMLDMGFIPDLEKIAKMLPPIRQTLMFSATMPPIIEKLASKFMSFPKRISVSPPSSTAATVEQSFHFSHNHKEKNEKVADYINNENVQNALIFCNRKRDIAEVRTHLTHATKAKVGALHGDMVQSERTKTLDLFKQGVLTVLVCSDVAARGLDIKELSHVINYDIPSNSEDYVHRIGRTGRAGKEGKSLTLVGPSDEKYFDAVRKITKVDISAPENFFSKLKTGGRPAAPARGKGGKPASSSAASRPAAKTQTERPTNPKQEPKPAERKTENKPAEHKAAAPHKAPTPKPRSELTERPERSERRNSREQQSFPGDAKPISKENDSHSFGDDVPHFLRKR